MLQQRGVRLWTRSTALELEFTDRDPSSAVSGIIVDGRPEPSRIDAGTDDLVFVTLGSMTDGSVLGAMETPARLAPNGGGAAWALWRSLARRSPHFGRPEVFCGEIPKSYWMSFTVTLRDPLFFEFMEKFTGNAAGTGGAVTFSKSSWLLSVVLAHQPHFRDQPKDAWVFWGYALRPGCDGDLVGKPMSACSGREILEELCHHLPLGEAGDRVLASANCIPCVLPYITSEFMPRMAGDRPAVIPQGVRNLAFLGQFCEVPEDTVFTVEYSVRTAQMAVYGLLDPNRAVTPLYRGYRHPGVVLRALRALM